MRLLPLLFPLPLPKPLLVVVLVLFVVIVSSEAFESLCDRDGGGGVLYRSMLLGGVCSNVFQKPRPPELRFAVVLKGSVEVEVGCGVLEGESEKALLRAVSIDVSKGSAVVLVSRALFPVLLL